MTEDQEREYERIAAERDNPVFMYTVTRLTRCPRCRGTAVLPLGDGGFMPCYDCERNGFPRGAVARDEAPLAEALAALGIAVPGKGKEGS